jgi:hypothetical protein
VQPGRAAVLAAELRNAITPAALARGDDSCTREELVEAVGWTLAHVRQVIEALHTEGRAERPAPPERDSSGGYRLDPPTCGPCVHIAFDSDPYRCRRHGMVPLRMVDGELRRCEGCTGPETAVKA